MKYNFGNLVDKEVEDMEPAVVVVGIEETSSCAACVVRRQQPETTKASIPARYDLSNT